MSRRSRQPATTTCQTHLRNDGITPLTWAEAPLLCRQSESKRDLRMSVTMMLRRPELDVASLGAMNLVASSTLSPAIPEVSKSHARSHTSNNGHSVRGGRRPKRGPFAKGKAMVPHLALAALHGCTEQDTTATKGTIQEAKSGPQDRTAAASRVWSQVEHGQSSELSMVSQAQQASCGIASTQAQTDCLGTGPNLDDFQRLHQQKPVCELPHRTQKLDVQLLGTGVGAESDAASAALTRDSRALLTSRALSNSPGPALDTDSAAAEANVDPGQPQSPSSMRPSALQSELSRKSSTVRFVAPHPLTPTPKADPSSGPSQGIGAGHSDLNEESHMADKLHPHGTEMLSPDDSFHGTVRHTVSASLTASSLRSVLKKTTSSSSVAGVAHGSNRMLESSGISFALDAATAGENSHDEHDHEVTRHANANAAAQSSGLVMQDSECFPAWLVGGCALLQHCICLTQKDAAMLSC